MTVERIEAAALARKGRWIAADLAYELDLPLRLVEDVAAAMWREGRLQAYRRPRYGNRRYESYGSAEAGDPPNPVGEQESLW